MQRLLLETSYERGIGLDTKNETSELVPRLVDKNVIGTKWLFRNNMVEQGEVVRKKERLACIGYSQQEGIGYEKTYALLERIEVVRLFLAYSTYKKFKIY